METIAKENCQKIGFFRKTHGVRGELVLEFESRFEESVAEAGCFLVELEGLLVPFFPEDDGFRFKTATTAIVKFVWADSEKYARRMIGCPVYLDQNDIIDEEEDEIHSYLLGFLVEDAQLGKIGAILHVDDYSGNIVLTVEYRGNEVLIPFSEDFLVSLNEQQKTLKLNLPDGLIDL
jgi:16S rRNA processing protein RimM